MKKTILVGNNDTDVVEMLKRVLESEHYDVAIAMSGREATRKFEAGAPDLVLLNSSDADFEWSCLLDRIDGASGFLPVIGIAGGPYRRRHAIRREFDALVQKPLNLPVLLHVIRDLLAEPRHDWAGGMTYPKRKARFADQEAGAIPEGAAP